MPDPEHRSDIAIKPQVIRFQDLTRFRVRHILLVSSLYDSFILTEDGQLNEALLRQYTNLNLSQNPDLTRVSTGAEALELAQQERNRFDLIITSLKLGDMTAIELSEAVRAAGLDIPVVLIGYDNRALPDFIAKNDTSSLEGVFLWQGDVRVLLAIVKSVEDRRNVVHDTGEFGVPAILVVEDNAVNQRVVVQVLESMKCHVDAVANGQEALDQLERASYDLVFMDCQMPVMDGFEAARAIRELGGDYARLPIVALTANVLPADREACLEAGMNDFLPKPVKLDLLRSAVLRWAGDAAVTAD